MAGTERAESICMRWMVLVLVGMTACTPCDGQRTVAQGYVSPDVLKGDLARCAGRNLCFGPCIDAFGLTDNDEIETCKVTVNSSGGGWVEARYIDRSVCGTDNVIDGTTGVVVADDGSWDDSGDDGSGDEGTPPDDGSGDGSDSTPPDDGSGSDGTPPDDGSGDGGTGDGGSSDDVIRSPGPTGRTGHL
jgi:hypothetical protein